MNDTKVGILVTLLACINLFLGRSSMVYLFSVKTVTKSL